MLVRAHVRRNGHSSNDSNVHDNVRTFAAIQCFARFSNVECLNDTMKAMVMVLLISQDNNDVVLVLLFLVITMMVCMGV